MKKTRNHYQTQKEILKDILTDCGITGTMVSNIMVLVIKWAIPTISGN